MTISSQGLKGISRFWTPSIYGSLALVAANICFYLESVGVRWAATNQIPLSASFLVFFRFLVGLILVISTFLFKRTLPRPQHYHCLLGRAVTNILALSFFYKAIQVTTLAESSILNMTFPIFIAIFSWIMFKEQRELFALGMTVVAFSGIFLVLSPGEMQFARNSLWGLASGIISAATLLFLKAARQRNDTHTVMLFVFGMGTVVMATLFWNDFFLPTAVELYYLIFCAAVGISGQYLLTLGFRYVAPVKGSILLSLRILMAAFLGPAMTSDSPLNWQGWIGAGLIFGANLYFVLRKQTIANQQAPL